MHHTHDMQIAAKAREELALHKIDMSRVEVSVERGIVTLSGVVANEVERQNAVTTVFAIPGVQNVKNYLITYVAQLLFIAPKNCYSF